MTRSMVTVVLKKGRVKPVFLGHPWVFQGAIGKVEGSPADGDLVAVVDPGGRPLGMGWWHGKSAISVRIVAGLDGPPVRSFWDARLTDARGLREGVVATDSGSAWRWINGAGDGLPGVSVDVFGDVAAVAFSSLGAWRRRDDLLDSLMEVGDLRAIVEVDGGAPPKEGVPSGPRIVRGPEDDETVATRFAEHGVTYSLELPGGQKTGFYLDQRDNRGAVAAIAAGKRVLDLYCYQGAFALAAAKAGARSVVGVDSSPPAIKAARSHAGDAQSVEFVREDVVRYLKAAAERGVRFDVIVMDPPPFAKRRQHVDQALGKLSAIHSLALGVLKRRGFLLSSSCSQHIDGQSLERVIAQAARETPHRPRVLSRTGLPADHPVTPGFSEGRYLSSLLCRVP